MTGFISYIADLIFPEKCLRCGRTLLPGCGAIPPSIPPGWPEEALLFPAGYFTRRVRGGLELPARTLCTECWFSLSPADSGSFLEPGERVPVVSPFLTEDVLLLLVRALKFSGAVSVAEPLAWWMHTSLSGHMAAAGRSERRHAAVLPVPLHPARLRKRGFNQSLLLARAVARRAGVDLLEGALRRVRDTKPQSSLEGRKRKLNVEGAFLSVRAGLVASRDLILVDDLVTTGETVRSCIKALQEHSPSSIMVLSAGRRPPSRTREISA